MRLSELNNGDSGYIAKVMGRGAFRKRITEMGFIKGRKVTVVKAAPLDDPVEYNILGYEVSLRRSEANLIDVTTEEEAKQIENTLYNGIITEELVKKTAIEKGKTINVALVGNPNSGKTTFFNFASHSHERVGNYSGVTVDSKTATFKHKRYTINITDLPGTYSLTAYSPEELFVRHHITHNLPDVVINVVDASNLERNLYLTSQLIDMDLRIVLALNMYDELQARGDNFDYANFGKMLGIPVIPTVSSKGIGIRELFDKIINIYADKDKTYRHIHINYGQELEQSILAIQKIIKLNRNITDNYSSRFLAIKMLEKDKEAGLILTSCDNYTDIVNCCNVEIKRIESLYKEDSETFVTDTRYGFIAGALKETLTPGVKERRRTTEIIDSVITHKFLGFPVFFFFLWIMFQATFKLGEYPKLWLEHIVSFIGEKIDLMIHPGPLNDLITDGIIGGVGGVIVFLPNILLLFFFISFMEDTGYMARVAFIMDKLMHKIGLHGKSFIPLIMGFGCNVPAIMATRTIENRNNRLLTILINPFMSCSARLPVYILFIAAFFPHNAGTILFLLYFIGIVLAIGVALIFKKTLFKSDEIPFVMELPPYRIPTMRSTLKHMWHKGEQYLKKMGGVILVASILIWALGYYPRNVQHSQDYEKLIENTNKEYAALIDNTNNSDTINILNLEKDSIISSLVILQKSEHQEQSYIGKIGKFIEPAMKPLGFDWKIGVSLITGIAAKEVIVSTFGVLYQAKNENSDENSSLQHKIKQQIDEKGNKIFTPLVVISLLLFILIYFPCIAVMAAIKRETGHWKWSLFVIFYTTALAYFISFVVYQLGSLHFI